MLMIRAPLRGISRIFISRVGLLVMVGLLGFRFRCSLLPSICGNSHDLNLTGIHRIVIKRSKSEKEEMEWNWQTRDPHPSLSEMIKRLDRPETRIRDWLIGSRRQSESGIGIGLGATNQKSSFLHAAAPNPTMQRKPDSAEGPGVFQAGSYKKYAELLQEWHTGRKGSPCNGDAWSTIYTQLHSEIMAGKQKPKLMEFQCDSEEPCGGLADRILGTVTTFMFSIITRRAFVVNWENPMPFDLLFDSPHIDWSFPYIFEDEVRHSMFGLARLRAQRITINAMQWSKDALDQYFSSDKWLRFTAPWVRVRLNRGLVIRSFSYDSVASQLRNLGLNADTAFSCLIDYLIRPKASALEFIHQYSSLFALPTVYSIGIQIRTGDDSMRNASYDQLNTVDRHHRFFDCADQAARRFADPGQRIVYYLISDSHNLLKDAMAKFPDRVIVSGLGIRHIDTDPTLKMPKHASLEIKDATTNSVIEAWTLASTDFRVLTEQSGFGKVATLLKGQTGRTITIFPEYDKDILITPWRRAPNREHLDCGLDSALVSFSSLADHWSLG